ncbi:MAG: alpha/beta fold hydrolase [Candidatus Lustribacter sp.]
MATFLLAHGAWSAAWAWKKMRPLMAAAGHTFVAPTCTGLGERAHLATPAIDLETHVGDLLAVLHYEDLHDVVLVAHSYGGMVATGVADRAAERIAQLIYLDAFVPRDGQSLADLVPAAQRERMRAAAAQGDGWRVPPNPTPADTSPEDATWIADRRLPQPLKCFEQPLRLHHGEPVLPRAYIRAVRYPSVTFDRCAERARSERGWRSFEIDATHSPNVTAPRELMALLDRVAGAR